MGDKTRSLRTVKQLVAVGLLLGLSFVAGWWFRGAGRPPPPGALGMASAPVTSATDAGPVREPAAEGAPATSDRIAATAPTAAELAAAMARLRGTERLRAALVLRDLIGREDFRVPGILGGPEFDRDAAVSLSDPFSEAMELTATERGRLESALAAAQAATDRVTVELADVRRSADGRRLLIEVPPFPEAGARIFDQLYREFAETLGADRLALFHAAYPQGLEGFFAGMGTRARSVSITLVPEAEPGKLPSFTIERTAREEYRSTSTTSTYVFWSDLRQAAGAFAPLLPLEPPPAPAVPIETPPGP